MKTVTKLVIAVGACLSASTFDVPVGRASGNAPWCAVLDLGTGEVVWDCHYRTVEECRPNVLAGNRGFCNVNPYGAQPNGPITAVPSRHRKHFVRRN